MYFGSRPYWKNAVVGSPPGTTEPLNPAAVMPTVPSPVLPDVGVAVMSAESVATALLPPRVTVIVIV